MRRAHVLSFAILATLVMSLLTVSADALKSEGTSLLETNSKKVCGDMLCSEVNKMPTQDAAEQQTQFDDSMVLQQSVQNQVMPSQLSSAFTVIKKPLAIQSFFAQSDFTKSKNVLTLKQMDIKETMAKKMGSFVKRSSTAEVFEIKNKVSLKSLSPKISNEIGKVPLKFTPIPMKIDSKIRFDSKDLNLKLEKVSSKTEKIENQIKKDSKFFKMIEDLKDKKIEIKKSK